MHLLSPLAATYLTSLSMGSLNRPPCSVYEYSRRVYREKVAVTFDELLTLAGDEAERIIDTASH